MAKASRAPGNGNRGGSPPGLLHATPGLLCQDLFGRIPHRQQQVEIVQPGEGHRVFIRMPG